MDFWPEPGRSNDVPVTTVDLKLRPDKGLSLTTQQRGRINDLLVERVSTFEEGGGATPFVEHRRDEKWHAGKYFSLPHVRAKA